MSSNEKRVFVPIDLSRGDAPGHTLEYSAPIEEWEDDRKVYACPYCHAAFTVVQRKHHCRCCGLVVCQRCSSNNMQLPHYNVDVRVCNTCKRQIQGLRSWIERDRHLLVYNVSQSPGCVPFTLYLASKPAFASEVWLSASLLLVMYRDSDHGLKCIPVSQLDRVSEAGDSYEFKSRLTSSMCCFSVPNQEMQTALPDCFTLHITDGRTLDIQAPSKQARTEWVAHFRDLITFVKPFASYHNSRGALDERTLLAAEKTRLQQLDLKALQRNNKREAIDSRARRRDELRAKYKLNQPQR